VLNQQRLPNSKGLIDFLKNLDGLLVNSGNYFIRPKTNYKIEEFQQLIKNEHVNFVLSDKCSTSELISMVDLVVAPAGSGAVCECSLLRKKVIGYDYFGRYLSKYWIRYGKDACLDNVDDLKNVLLKYLTNETVEVNWEKLWDEVVYPNNGNTNQIIEGMI
jgi:hypothetical protein